MEPRVAQTRGDIQFCQKIILEFRPNLNVATFEEQILKMMGEEQFKLVFIPDPTCTKAVAFIGYRRQMMLRTGPIIYIDDLFTTEASRGLGYARALLEYVKQEAVTTGIASIHLDSGYHLHNAHRLYLNSGYMLVCNHFAQPLDQL